MPSPATANEFLDLVRKSELVDAQRLEKQIEKTRDADGLPAEAPKMAGVLVRDGLLTHFQAEQILQGKWRRFSIGKYQVLERLGAGGMGSVYLCEHKLMRRRVAVKVLPSSKAEDQAALDRFYREARAVAALDHPNIVRAYDIDNDEKLHFLVMEHVDGSNLQEIIKANSKGLDPIRAAHYVRQAALGLQHAHETAGLVHRDIKPGNILVDRNGIVKVLDMGLARFFHDEDDIITQKYDENVLGTADYLAPEQALDSHGADIRADVYSLGATFYFCLAGHAPFAEGSVAQKLIWHQTRQPKPLSQERDDVPDGIVAIVERMMAKDRDERFQSPLEVSEALAPWTQSPIAPPPEKEMPRLSPALMTPGSDGRSEDGRKKPGSSARRAGWEVATAGPSTPSSPTDNDKPESDSRPPHTATPPPETSRPSGRKQEKEPAPSPAPKPAPSPPPKPSAASPAPTRLASPAPRTVPATPPPQTVVPVSPAPAAAQQLTQSETETDAAVDVEETPWRDLVDDTDAPSAAQADTPTSSRGRVPARRRRATGKVAKSTDAPAPKRLTLWIAGGVLLVAVGALCLWIFGGDNGTTEDPDGDKRETKRQAPPAGRELHVGKDKDNTTIAAALLKAGPRDRIVVHSPVKERLRLNRKEHGRLTNVTIEAAPDKKITWTAPDKAVTAEDAEQPLILVAGARGFTIRGFEMTGVTGGKKLDYLIRVTYACPGITLENLVLRDYVQAGVHFVNCQGTAEQPITLKKITTDDNNRSKAAPITFEALDNVSGIKTNNHVHVLGDCRFWGKPIKEMARFGLKAKGNDVRIDVAP